MFAGISVDESPGGLQYLYYFTLTEPTACPLQTFRIETVDSRTVNLFPVAGAFMNHGFCVDDAAGLIGLGYPVGIGEISRMAFDESGKAGKNLGGFFILDCLWLCRFPLIAPLRSASLRFASSRYTPVKFAPRRFAWMRFAG